MCVCVTCVVCVCVYACELKEKKEVRPTTTKIYIYTGNEDKHKLLILTAQQKSCVSRSGTLVLGRHVDGYSSVIPDPFGSLAPSSETCMLQTLR